jgi:Uncharacterised nucleotidyltransferase
MAKPSNTLTDTVSRPEDELVLCCARTDIDSDTTERIQMLLQESVDWEYLIGTASKQGVKPLLCSGLNKRCPKSVPKPITDQLQRYLQAHFLRNLFLTRQLLKILRTLEQNRIPAIPWKGPVLAAMAYGNVALRQFGDLDILVREQDSMRAKDLLLASGYRPLYPQPAEQEAAYYALRKVYELVREDGRVVVELHWAITSRTFPFHLDPASLWVEAETVSLEDTPVRNLGPEDLLLVLSVHGAKHHWGKLMWICDIAEVVRSYADKVDWSRLMTRARSLGATRILALALFLARDLLGAAVPEDVWRRVKAEPKVAWLAGQVKSGLFSGGILMAVERPAFYIQLRERAQDRMRCRAYLGYRMLAPSAQAWTLGLLHSGRSILHFLRHP